MYELFLIFLEIRNAALNSIKTENNSSFSKEEGYTKKIYKSNIINIKYEKYKYM